jgi:uncharacterized protein YlaN (UPF0358 family)
MSDTPLVKKYIDSVDGMAHQSATQIIIDLEKELAACSAAFDKQQKQLDKNAEQIASKQAQIDRLMMEHCPIEMSLKQIARWKKHQIIKEEGK